MTIIAQYGALKTLILMLQSAPSLQGCSVVFGEEYIAAQDQPLPMVVVVPDSGTWTQPGAGYFRGSDPNLDNVWSTQENINLYLWAAADLESNPPPQPIDHADAVEILRTNVLQAFQDQLPNGLYFKPITGAWQRMADGVNRYGRAYMLTVQVEIPVTAYPYPQATILKTTLSPSIEQG